MMRLLLLQVVIGVLHRDRVRCHGYRTGGLEGMRVGQGTFVAGRRVGLDRSGGAGCVAR